MSVLPSNNQCVRFLVAALGLADAFEVAGHGSFDGQTVGDHGTGVLTTFPMWQEQTGLPFASAVPSRMHACGHKIHTATLLGVGEVLASMAPWLRGRVHLVFQPAKETVESGAAAMVADGAVDGADFALAFHNWPEMPVGCFGYTRGAATASADKFDVVLRGRSGHAAQPHSALNPIVAARAGASLVRRTRPKCNRSGGSPAPAHSGTRRAGRQPIGDQPRGIKSDGRGRQIYLLAVDLMERFTQRSGRERQDRTTRPSLFSPAIASQFRRHAPRAEPSYPQMAYPRAEHLTADHLVQSLRQH